LGLKINECHFEHSEKSHKISPLTRSKWKNLTQNKPLSFRTNVRNPYFKSKIKMNKSS